VVAGAAAARVVGPPLNRSQLLRGQSMNGIAITL